MNGKCRILIAGCGDVGGELGRLLLAEDHEVWGLRRSIDRLPEDLLASGLRPIAADLGDPSTLRDLPQDLDYVVYSAAASGHDPDAYRAAYVDGWKHVRESLQAAEQSPRRVIFTSSTGVYGQNDGSWVDESSPTEPTSFSGKIMREAETQFLESPWPATVLRLAGIYGPGRLYLVRQIREGRARLSSETVYANRIHRDDCASALAHLLKLDLDGGEPQAIYVGVDDEPVPKNDVLTWMAERLDLDPPQLAAPGESASRRGGNKRCRNDRLRAEGWRPTFPSFRDGYAPILAALKS